MFVLVGVCQVSDLAIAAAAWKGANALCLEHLGGLLYSMSPAVMLTKELAIAIWLIIAAIVPYFSLRYRFFFVFVFLLHL